MVYAVYLYTLGASLQRAAEAIEAFCQRARQSVHDWVQRLGGVVREAFCLVNGPLPDVLVVDETEVQVGSQTMYLWVALDPETRAVYHLALTEVRNILVAWSFFRAIRRRYGRYPSLVITDGGTWYRWPLRRLGILHEVLSGGVRSYVERWNETLKDRSRPFDKYHPCRKEGCDRTHVLNWAFLVAFWYNHARRHQSLGMRPPLAPRGEDRPCWELFVLRLTEALS